MKVVETENLREYVAKLEVLNSNGFTMRFIYIAKNDEHVKEIIDKHIMQKGLDMGHGYKIIDLKWCPYDENKHEHTEDEFIQCIL